jgi:hypothetical protein
VGSSEPHGAVDAPGSHMVCRALVQAVLRLVAEKLRLRFGGHNMGPAPVLLDDAMKAVKAAIMDHATTRRTAIPRLIGGRRWGGGSRLHQAKRLRYFRHK